MKTSLPTIRIKYPRWVAEKVGWERGYHTLEERMQLAIALVETEAGPLAQLSLKARAALSMSKCPQKLVDGTAQIVVR